MEDRAEIEKLSKDIELLHRKIDDLEYRLLVKSKNTSSVWVLVPVAAIVMWGLTQIFG